MIRQHVLDEIDPASLHYTSQDQLGIKLVGGFTQRDRKKWKKGDGFCQFRLRPSDQWQVLPTRTCEDAIEYLNAPWGKEIRYNHTLNQYEIRWPHQTGSTAPVMLQYLLRPRKKIPTTHGARTFCKISSEDKSFLEQMFQAPLPTSTLFSLKFRVFHKKCQDFLQGVPAPTLAQKQDFCTQALADFCKDFDNAHLAEESKALPAWQRVLLEAKGSCRHRAYVFCKVAR